MRWYDATVRRTAGHRIEVEAPWCCSGIFHGWAMDASELLKSSLKTSLLKLECPFTWWSPTKDCDINDMEERLNDQVEFLITTRRYMIYNSLAYIKHLKGENEEAIAQLGIAEEHIPKTQSDERDIKCVVTYGNYAWLYYHTNELEKAQDYINKVATIHKKFETALSSNVLLAEIYGEHGWCVLTFCREHYEKAKECFQKALEIDPENPEWNTGYATAVYRLEGVKETKCPTNELLSLELLKRAVQLNPKDTVVRALLGLKHQDLNHAKEAKKCIEEARRQTPDYPYLLRYVAKFYRREGMTKEALDVLHKAIQLTPSSGFLHHQAGHCYRQNMIQLKRDAKAAKFNFQPTGTYTQQIREMIRYATFYFEKALELKTSFVCAHIDLANMYTDGNQYQKAEETFKKVLSMENLTCEEKQRIHNSYGVYEEYHRKSESEAIRHHKEVLMISIRTKTKQRSEKNLNKLAERIIKRNPSDATGFALLGFVHQQNGENMQAIDCYEKAHKRDPYNEEYLSALCDMRLKI
ncbi:interferon-induced protein with tetratricopeptide repeats 5-like isoform X2 [Ascaphus truei]|uniref:interferon-induced protein with tetratricopeptide repeats 5-like isoform X2 n=1 Tax=Ascaphus truei TaxID=8439 RepID=UPI003F595B13